MILVKKSETAAALKCSSSHVKTITVSQREENNLIFLCTIKKIYI